MNEQQLLDQIMPPLGEGMHWRPFSKHQVACVDAILKAANGKHGSVESELDWKLLEEMWKIYAWFFPAEVEAFKQSVAETRATRNVGGYSATKEMIYLGAIPGRFMKMVQVIFDTQRFDKKFSNKLVKRLSLFAVASEVRNG